MESRKELLRQLLEQLGRPDLIDQVGMVPDYVILKQILDQLPPSERKAAQGIISQALAANKTREFLLRMKSTKAGSFPDTELVGAMTRGIHPETYTHNKSLPLSDKLKLPVWEAIYALNIKDKPNEHKTTRNRRRRI